MAAVAAVVAAVVAAAATTSRARRAAATRCAPNGLRGYDVEAGAAWSVVVKGRAVEVTRLHDVLEALELPFTNLAADGAVAPDVLARQVPRLRGPYAVGTLYVGANDARGIRWDPAAFARDTAATAPRARTWGLLFFFEAMTGSATVCPGLASNPRAKTGHPTIGGKVSRIG
jgi:hypothetical protein